PWPRPGGRAVAGAARGGAPPLAVGRRAPSNILEGPRVPGVPGSRHGRERRGSGIENRSMSLAVVGINHRTAPVRVRERLAYSRAEIPAALRRLLGSGALDEAVLLSTCNRTEVYLSAADETLGEAAARELLAEQWREPQPILSYLYARRGRSVVEHLFRVTSGIDSMI